MAAFSDTFTGTSGTNLTSHTADSGESWSNLLGAIVLSDANRARGTSTADNYKANWTPTSADYDVELDLRVFSNDVNNLYALGRISGTNNWYQAGYRGGANNGWVIGRTVNGTYTQLAGQSTPDTLTVGSTYRIKLEMRGTAIKLYVDDVLKQSVTDSTHTAAGNPGVRTQANATTNSTGYHFDNMAASDPAAAVDFAFTDIANHRVLQRSGTTASIVLSGTYVGTDPTDIQARVMDGASEALGWTTLTSASIGSEAWQGTLSGIPQGGPYTLEAQSRDSGASVLDSAVGTNAWLVGDNFGVIGSSSAEKWFTVGTGYSPDALLREYDGGWLDASTTGAAAVTVGNQLIADSGVPIAFLDYGVGGSTLAQWSDSGNANYTTFTAAVAAIGGKLAGVYSIVGMNDARNGTIVSQADHETKYRTLISNIRSATGQASLPIFIGGSQRNLEGDADPEEDYAWVRQAELAVATDANVYLATTTVDLPMDPDNIHLTEAGMVTTGERVARTIGAVLYSTGLEYRDPVIASAVIVDDTHTDIQITHRAGSDFTPTSAITGFEVSVDDFANTLAISAAVRQSASVIRLTHATTGGTPPKVRYQYGRGPTITGAVKDNSSMTYPLQYTAAPITAAEASAATPYRGGLSLGQGLSL